MVFTVVARGLGQAFKGTVVDVMSSSTVLVLAVLVALPFGFTLRGALDDIERTTLFWVSVGDVVEEHVLKQEQIGTEENFHRP